jgi:hypothetical protein
LSPVFSFFYPEAKVRMKRIHIRGLSILLLCIAVVIVPPVTTIAAPSYKSIDLYKVSNDASQLGFPGGTAAAGQSVDAGYILSSPHARLWIGPAGNLVDLNPTNLAGFDFSQAEATDGVHQVGHGQGSGNGIANHALLWSGTANSAIDLHPITLSGFDESQAHGTGGNQQVGDGSGSGTAGAPHALLWTGTALSAVDLNPTNLGIQRSSAFATDGIHQVGTGDGHALLWSATATSAVDLHPMINGYFYSAAYGTRGNQQVGYGSIAMVPGDHALLWSGTAASAVDLHPTNLDTFFVSQAFDTNGSRQVGFGINSTFKHHALLWSGTPDSAVDLHLLLPSIFLGGASNASTIDANGNVFGIAIDSNNKAHVVEWIPIPEPTSLALAIPGILALLVYHSRRRD